MKQKFGNKRALDFLVPNFPWPRMIPIFIIHMKTLSEIHICLTPSHLIPRALPSPFFRLLPAHYSLRFFLALLIFAELFQTPLIHIFIKTAVFRGLPLFIDILTLGQPVGEKELDSFSTGSHCVHSFEHRFFVGVEVEYPSQPENCADKDAGK